MKASLKKLMWTFLCCVGVFTIVIAVLHWRKGNSLRQEFADTRRALREQGFKTDLGDFYYTTDDATRARVAVLGAAYTAIFYDRHNPNLNLLPVVSNDTATVIWKQDFVRIGRWTNQWDNWRHRLDPIRAQVDAARDAVLSGPIGFDVNSNRTYNLLDDHHAQLWHLSMALCDRAILELHDGNPDAAWTNLLATTRLVTALTPNSTRFYCFPHVTDSVFALTWQALQFNGWGDAKLAALQQEWESVNYFTDLSEIAAHNRAGVAYACQQMSQESLFLGISFSELAQEFIRSPSSAYPKIKEAFAKMHYRGNAALDDGIIHMRHFRDREIELRHAIQAPTWAEMRTLPGVTNVVPVNSPYSFMKSGVDFDQEMQVLWMARVAVAEAERRILITAIALERYRGKRGAYPATLASLSPEFLKVVPVDFMDGKPLRYRLTDDGHFVLYSIRLDCVDDGGKLSPPNTYYFPRDYHQPLFVPMDMDIIWLRPDTGRVQANSP